MHILRDRFAIAFLIGLALGALGFYAGQQILKGSPSSEDLIAEYYRVENAVSVSPHSLRGKMDKGDQGFLLVDLRSQEEYEKEHIIGAFNVPAYSDKYNSAYDEVERIVNSFKQLQKDYPGRDLIVYCYSRPCMTGRKVGGMLAEHGVFVKHLNIGWYEWRHDWNSWNHEHEWNTTKVEEYIWSGEEPGVPTQTGLINPCSEGELGC
jgi:rhodanese-related sulfurtransferase